MSKVDRRQYLGLVAAVATAGALAGCSEIARERPKTPTRGPGPGPEPGPVTTRPGPAPDRSERAVRYGVEFDRILDAVADLGMDPTGERPIDDAFESFLARRRTLLEFPPGVYRFDENHAVESVDNLGILGRGRTRSDVVFRTPSREGRQFVNVRAGGVGFLLENVTFDHGPGDGSIGNVLRLDDRLRVQNVEHVGFNPIVQNGALDNLSPQILTEGGLAVVDSYVRTGPTHIVSHGSLDGTANAGCIWLGEDHVGTLRIRNCHFANTGTNAIYCSRAPGRVEVVDCRFENNNQASLRIGGKGTLVRGCTFRFDTDDAHRENLGEHINPNAILWETGNRGQRGGVIESCSFVYDSAPVRTNAAIWADGSAGAFTVRDCRFSIDVPGVRAIRVDDPRRPRLGKTAARPWGVTLTNIVVEGRTTGFVPMIEISGRPNSTLDGCCLSVSDATHVVKLVSSPGSSIQNVNVSETGEWLTIRRREWLIAQEGEFVVDDVSYEQICRANAIQRPPPNAPVRP
ncbi:Right handed beta helix region [Halogranum amylolyticum]|uniref:Right handed beta helix region n=1 Tax=Halogranum amylolyticum TaxID=660520 RepID=A0A1H8MZH1_9EURY|nr:right-handed parallel beta-helix repeat-containing protein [Halogranum amylolyticum]SEO22781.1 Right handed beta helix region [Halogranum amylolyticum]